MPTKLWAALLVLFTTFLTSAGQILYKLGSKSLEFNVYSILTNHYLILGAVIYAIGGILIIVSLRGGEVSVLYPIIATSYIWVTLSSIIFFNESINWFKSFGIIAIIIGISLIGFGSKEAVSGAL